MAFAPATVAWDELTLTGESSSLSFMYARTAEPALIVQRSRGNATTEVDDTACRPGPELVLDVTFSLLIDDGAVSGDVPGSLAVPVDGSTIFVDAYGVIALDASWENAAITSFEERNPGATATEWHFVVSFQEWKDGAMVGIDGAGDGNAADVGESTSALWRGHWSGAE
jgi:hypothetical protein